MNSILRTASLSVIGAAVCLTMSGCGTQQAMGELEKSSARLSDTVKSRMDAKIADISARPADHDVPTPWIVGRSVELDRKVVLPKVLTDKIKPEFLVRGSESLDLLHAAQLVGQAIGMPVRVTSDALLPANNFAPKTSAASGQQQVGSPAGVIAGPQASPAGVPVGAGTAASVATPATAYAGAMSNIKVNMLNTRDMSASDLLDHLASQIGAYWRYEKGGVEIYRLVTRTFEIHTQVGKTSVTSALGRSGSQGSTFASNSETKIDQSNVDAMAEIRLAVDAMLTRGGALATGNGTLVVTDTKDSVERVGRYVESVNRDLTRRVQLYFEAIEVTAKDANETGINWDIVFNRIGQLANGGVINTQVNNLSPTTLVSGLAGGLNMVLSGATQLNGSQMLVKALADVGTVTNHTKVPMTTLNRKPVQYAVRTTFDYVASIQVTTVASSAGTSSAPAITQKEETVGLVLTVTPSAFSDGRILMNVAYDSTALRSLEPYSTGAGVGGSSATVQQRTIDGTGAMQSVSLKSGQSLMISGIDKLMEQYDQRRLDKSLPMVLSGSDRTKKSRTSTILVITALSEDGA